MWPSVIGREDMAKILDVPLARVKEWSERKAIVQVERGKFHRNDIAVGALILSLQGLLGQSAPLVFEIAALARPRIAGCLGNDREQMKAITVEFSADEGLGVIVSVGPEVFLKIADKLDELAAA